MQIRARILPVQIPQLWEVIKFACTQADEVNKEDMPPYLNELLHALLSEKAQCFLRLGDDRSLQIIMITRITIDKITGEKYLFLQCLYSFKVVRDEILKQDWDFVMEFAKNEKCSYIYFDSRHERIWEISKIAGFKEKNRRFDLRIGGV